MNKIDGNVQGEDEIISLKELCDRWEISLATGRNWVKLGKITAVLGVKPLVFLKKDVETWETQFHAEGDFRLKNRRNKSQRKGNAVYYDYLEKSGNLLLMEKICENPLETWEIKLILAEFSLQSFGKRLDLPDSDTNLLEKFLVGKYSVGIYDPLIWDLIPENCGDFSRIQSFLQEKFVYETGADDLGFAYLSLRCVSGRKQSGAYYTPEKTVKNMINLLKKRLILQKSNCLDPCCGTGNFLLYLAKERLDLEHLQGYDVDFFSVALARINLALVFLPTDIAVLRKKIQQLDYLSLKSKENYDLILGNPPWGAFFSIEEKKDLQERFSLPYRGNLESYDLFLAQSFLFSGEKSMVSFVLPEAILSVKAHQFIRGKCMDSFSISYVARLGDIFSGVQCPTILLGLEKNKDKNATTQGCLVELSEKSFVISDNRPFYHEEWPVFLEDGNYHCIRKLENAKQCVTLMGQADFAMGIVTGDNKNLLKKENDPNLEGILKGNDLTLYDYRPESNYISFTPDNFQQIADVSMYRCPEKLFYKFISDSLVFSYDNQGKLSLNSCNILIPRVETMGMKYILAILNSDVANFYFQKKFNSVKVLKSHLERIPIPKATKEEQDEIVKLVDEILKNPSKKQEIHQILQEKIYKLYDLTSEEQRLIEDSRRKK